MSATKAYFPSPENAIARGPETMSPNAPSSPGLDVLAWIDRRASGSPLVPSRIESAGNTVLLNASVGCGVSIPSIRCATHTSFVPGRGATS